MCVRGVVRCHLLGLGQRKGTPLEFRKAKSLSGGHCVTGPSSALKKPSAGNFESIQCVVQTACWSFPQIPVFH